MNRLRLFTPAVPAVPAVPAALVLLAGLAIARPARCGEMKDELDCVANVRLLDTHFARYGYSPAKTMTRDMQGNLRIRLPAETKDVGQTGLYSYVVLAGDFEVSASYEWIAVTPPTQGYGVSCGIALDMGGLGPSVSLARASLQGQGNGYAVTRGEPAGTETKYNTELFRTEAKRGRLVVRREARELICLVADGPKEPLRELWRDEFPARTLHQVRFYADAGGSPTYLDVRLGQFRLRAEEITGGFPKRDQPGSFPWWTVAAVSFAALAVVLWLVRRRQQDR